jgi:hypothetical protein
VRAFAHRLRPADERESFRQFTTLVQDEPALVPLLIEVMRVQPTTSEFYLRFKPRVQCLAGWSARNPSLRTEQAYNTVYEVIYSFVFDSPESPA